MPLEFLEQLLKDALVLALAVVLDRVLPEPPNAIHPGVWMGRLTTALERLAPRRALASFFYGCGMVAIVVGLAIVAALS